MRTSKIFVTVDAVIIKKTTDNQLLLIKRKNEPFQNCWALPGGFVDENEDSEMGALEIPEINAVAKVEEIEEIKVVTKLTMPSRKLKIKISNELLVELEKMQINFKLN